MKQHPERDVFRTAVRLSRSVRGAGGTLWLLAGCAGPTDVAALVHVDAGQRPNDEATTGLSASANERPRDTLMDAGPGGSPPAASAPPTGAPASADPDWRGPFTGGGPDDEPPFGQDQGARDALWVSGWPLSDWTDTTQAWPLNVGLVQFFQSAREDLQVAVWVNGNDADVIEAWWSNIPASAPEILQLDGQRFVVTEDENAAVYAVTADRPPDGTSSYLPIPEGFDRD